MPTYYKEFQCVADKCPDTCCAGWGIVIDDKTMKQYQELPEKDLNYVFRHIDTEEGMYKRCKGRCSFLNDNNLCDLITNLGEEHLCKTCARYPRHFEEYGNLVEAALSLSCPVAARMILDRPESDRLLVKENDKKSPHDKEVDKLLLAGLLDIRRYLFGIIKRRNRSLQTRMQEMLDFAKHIQRPIYAYEKHGMKYRVGKNGATFLLGLNHLVTMDQLRNLKKLQKKADYLKSENEKSQFDKIEQNNSESNMTKREMLSENNSAKEDLGRYILMPQYIDMLYGLEQINGPWQQLVQEIDLGIYKNFSEAEYIALAKEFEESMSDREYEYEHLLYYFIYTYFLGSVYDYNVHAMVKLAVYSTIMIRELGFHIWLNQDKKFTLEDQIRVAYLYSREVEHSDDNLQALEGILNVHPLFENEKLMTCL